MQPDKSGGHVNHILIIGWYGSALRVDPCERVRHLMLRDL